MMTLEKKVAKKTPDKQLIRKEVTLFRRNVRKADRHIKNKQYDLAFECLNEAIISAGYLREKYSKKTSKIKEIDKLNLIIDAYKLLAYFDQITDLRKVEKEREDLYCEGILGESSFREGIIQISEEKKHLEDELRKTVKGEMVFKNPYIQKIRAVMKEWAESGGLLPKL